MADDEIPEFKPYTIPDEIPPVTAEDIQGMIAAQMTNQNAGQMKLSAGYFQSANFKSGSQGWQLTPSGNLEANNGHFRGDITGATGTFSGTVAVGSLNIPDSTTANSFHVDSSGNSWWGSNVAGGTSTAKAYILNTGAGYFQNIQVGGTSYQYTMNDTGVYTFGDGSDGNVVMDASTNYSTFSSRSGANYTLTRDVFAISLTVQNNVFLFTNGYRIFCQNAITLQTGGQILRDGNAGSGSTPGAAVADGYLTGSLVGTGGAAGGTKGSASAGSVGSTSSSPASLLNCLNTQSGGASGSSGASGGTADAFGGGGAGSGAVAATTTYRNIKPCLLWNFMSFFDINADGSLAKYTSGPSGAGGGGGGGGAAGAGNNGINYEAGAGGNGGGGGSAGGIVFIAARSITIQSSSNIFARGGAGGAGSAGGNAIAHSNPTAAAGGGGGGGGGGGCGGIVFLIYNTLTNAGTITVTGGAGGAAGAGGTHLGNATDGGTGGTGSSGAAGLLVQINMAL